jgi:hypothetical protein
MENTEYGGKLIFQIQTFIDITSSPEARDSIISCAQSA